MPTLLISLGNTPAIVPEAFLLPGVKFDSVHVLTTAKTEVGFVREWFTAHAPTVHLTLTRVEAFVDFTSDEDHYQFEEVLYRWWLLHAGDAPPYVCLSGGFKTMSAAMQKAATVLGAADLFHVLCNLPGLQQPKTAAEIQAAVEGGLLHWIRLGAESGWPQFGGLSAAAFPLEESAAEDWIMRVRAPDLAFRNHLREIVERSQRIAGAWDGLGSLPFTQLATWGASDLAWLREPLDPATDHEWVAALPKVELHCHLGGFATHGEILHAVRAAAANPPGLPPLLDSPQQPPGWPQPPAPVDLKDYMKLGDANGSALLCDPGCLRRQCELLHASFIDNHVVHAEVRCSPANYAGPGRSPWTVLGEIKAAFDRCMAETPGCHVNLIVIATRKETGDYRAAISRHLALAVSAAEHWTAPAQCRVVGVDLAGYEDISTRAHYFREEFTGIHRCGLALTVHAGENDDAEGIWRAVFDLNARRLGHALHLVHSPELMRSVAERGIGVEMCPYANLQIKGFPLDPASANATGIYPLKRYLDAGIPVTVNTDNIGISAASLTENFLVLARLCPGITRRDVLQLIRNGIDQAFLPATARVNLLSRVQFPSPQ